MTTPSHKPPIREETMPSKKRPRRPLRRPPVQSHDRLRRPNHRVGLSPGPQPTRALAHRDLQQAPFPTNDSLRVHQNRRSHRQDPVDPFDRLVRARALRSPPMAHPRSRLRRSGAAKAEFAKSEA